MIYFLAAPIVVFFVAYFRLYLYLFPVNRLIILMYHQIDASKSDELTVTSANLEKQFQYLSEKKYNAVFFKNILEKSKKKIIITFDDGYYNNFEFLPPLLEKYGLKATIFIATNFISDGYGENKIMTYENLRMLDKRFFEIALHSHEHRNFRTLSNEEIEKDLQLNIKNLDKNYVTFSKVLAYPYGKYPKKGHDKKELFSTLRHLNIDYAVRIGNKINFFPTKNPYELCRIDVKGGDGLLKFKMKLIFGKLKLF